MRNEATVREANEAFYRAFEAMDVEQMAQSWVQSDATVCVHPGWDTLHGWPQIRESWRTIFANTGYMRFNASDVRIQIMEETACVSCIENIFTVIDGMTIHSRVACTNIFVWREERWLLLIHHGSPIAESQSIRVPDIDVNN